jgi:hypothetical protein
VHHKQHAATQTRSSKQKNEKRLDTQNLVNDHYNEISLRNSDYLKSEAYNLRTLQTAAVNHVSKIAGNYFGVLEKEIKRDARIYGKKRTKTNIALKPKKRMAKQKTHTHTHTHTWN